MTGAASGIGGGARWRWALQGAVVLNHLPGDEFAAGEIAEELRRAGGSALPFAADVSREEDIEAMFAEVRDRFGTMHILVNNAGIQSGARFQDMTLAQWRRVMAVNLDGQFLCARDAVREFLHRGPQPDVLAATGKIVCMSSVHQVIPWPSRRTPRIPRAG